MTIDTANTLPQEVASVVDSFIAAASDDLHSADAMRGRCMDYSMALADVLDGLSVADDDGDEYEIEAWACQVWMDRVPAALAGDEMAPGHYVCRVNIDGQIIDIDITAAQFAAMGWTGPRVGSY